MVPRINESTYQCTVEQLIHIKGSTHIIIYVFYTQTYKGVNSITFDWSVRLEFYLEIEINVSKFC